MRRPLEGLVILKAKTHPHLDREAAVFVDQDTLFNVFIGNIRSGLGIGADAVAVRLLGGQGETGGAG